MRLSARMCSSGVRTPTPTGPIEPTIGMTRPTSPRPDEARRCIPSMRMSAEAASSRTTEYRDSVSAEAATGLREDCRDMCTSSLAPSRLRAIRHISASRAAPSSSVAYRDASESTP